MRAEGWLRGEMIEKSSASCCFAGADVQPRPVPVPLDDQSAEEARRELAYDLGRDGRVQGVFHGAQGRI